MSSAIEPSAPGLPHRLLGAHAREHGPVAGHACLAELAPSTVHEVLNDQPVKPHRVRYYLQRCDPAFEERKAEVLEVYATAEKLRQIPQGERPVAVLSYDEKPGIQAIAVTAPDLPPRPGRRVRPRDRVRVHARPAGAASTTHADSHGPWL